MESLAVSIGAVDLTREPWFEEEMNSSFLSRLVSVASAGSQ